MLSSPGRACASHCPAACLADPLPRVDGHQARGSATLRSHTRRRARRTGAGSGRSPAHSGARTAPRPPSRTPGTLTPTATCGQIAAAAARAAANRRAGRRRAATQAPAAGSPGSPPARSCSWPPCPRWWASPWRCSSRRGRCSGTRGAPEGAAQSRSGWRRRATRRAGHHAGAGNTGSPWVAQPGAERHAWAHTLAFHTSHTSHRVALWVRHRSAGVPVSSGWIMR